jgi:hypothetical protein
LNTHFISFLPLLYTIKFNIRAIKSIFRGHGLRAVVDIFHGTDAVATMGLQIAKKPSLPATNHAESASFGQIVTAFH